MRPLRSDEPPRMPPAHPPSDRPVIDTDNYYMKHFIGVGSPLTEPIEGWADRALSAPSAAAIAECLKAPGKLDRPDAPPMLTQALRVRDWLNLFDDAAHRTLIRSLRRLHDAGARARHAANVQRRGGQAAEPWPAAAVAPSAEQPLPV